MLQIDENVQREIINHRSLRHPNIVRFKEVPSFPNSVFCLTSYILKDEANNRYMKL